ncbi:MAG: cob(I)yrinic acid a,c-diamide adenosyltransferase [Pseudomonadota bacterium]|nr:cob(I)yrinic acid a,c-diamide adenosyltransferase [Pseudomonadota bacterium]
MGNRLSKIYTKTGDDGTTGLGDGSRVRKSSLRVSAMGDIDELNCTIGLLRSAEPPKDMQSFLKRIQNALFDIGGELSIPNAEIFNSEILADIEIEIDRYNEMLPPLKEFLIPAGSSQVALAHLCRSVCRRAERSLVELSEEEIVRVETRKFVNRLSDYLFVIARVIGAESNITESLWQR